MGRKALALVLSMSLLWSMTVNPVLASDVENAEEVAIENAIVDSTEVEEVLPVAEVEETEVEAAVEEDTETEVAEDAVVEEAEVEDDAEAEVEDAETEVTEDTEVEEDAEVAEGISGECGRNLTWTLSDAGVLTISGTGKMVFSDEYDSPWYYYADEISEVVIEEGVTNIAAYAFDSCYEMQSITIPDSVTSIGKLAFYDCQELSNIVIPDSVTNIEASAFAGCENLKSIELPAGIKSIKQSTFGSCSALKNVTIPNSVTTIQYAAFAGCTSLKEVTIPDSVTKIEGKAFLNTGMKSITLSKNVKTLGDLAVGYSGIDYDSEPAKGIPVKGFTIYGYTSTKAESYANKNAFTFKSLDEDGSGSIIIVHEKSEDTHVIGSGEDLVIYCTGDFDKFVSVEMDGVLVDPSNYTAEEGSTIITFSSSYLDTLSPGKHKVTINFVDDSVSTYINIIGKNGEGAGSNGSSSGSYRPGTSSAAKTGDSANILMWMVLALAAAGVAGVTVAKKRKMD